MASIQSFPSISDRRLMHDPRPRGDSDLLNGLLELACIKTGAVRLAIIRFGEAGGRLETGYRMSSQLVHALLPQLDFANPWSGVWKVTLGMKTYHAFIVNLSGLNVSGRSMVALFEEASAITQKTLGRLEGIFDAWWHMLGNLGGENKDSTGLLHVCSACQDLRVEGHGWMKWDDYLHRVMKVAISHAICDSCCGELYGDLTSRHPDECLTADGHPSSCDRNATAAGSATLGFHVA